MRLSKGEKIFNTFNMLILIIIMILTLYPFWYIFIISITDASAVSTSNIYILPGPMTLDSYKAVFINPDLFSGYRVSILRVILGVALTLVNCSMMAFVVSRKHFIAKKAINLIIVISMFVSAGIIPFFIIVRMFGLTNNFWALVIPFAIDPFGVILIRNYFMGVPESLDESARIDGANDFKIFLRIYLPISVPIIATMCLFWAVWFWNDFIYGTYLVSKHELQPIQAVLLSVINNTSNSRAVSLLASHGVKIRANGESVKMAAIILSTVPILMVYPFVQKYFVHGITLGAVKE